MEFLRVTFRIYTSIFSPSFTAWHASLILLSRFVKPKLTWKPPPSQRYGPCCRAVPRFCPAFSATLQPRLERNRLSGPTNGTICSRSFSNSVLQPQPLAASQIAFGDAQDFFQRGRTVKHPLKPRQTQRE